MKKRMRFLTAIGVTLAIAAVMGVAACAAEPTPTNTAVPPSAPGDTTAPAPTPTPTQVVAPPPTRVTAQQPSSGGELRENTLDAILDRGELLCGVKADTPGFGVFQADGSVVGNDADYCRAMAAAVFGDVSRVQFIEATSGNRFELLAAREIDVLIRTTTWTASRDANLNVAFAPTTFYDGAGIMVRADAGYASVNDLDGARICILGGTSTEGAVADYFVENGLTYQQLSFEANPQLRAAFLSEQCQGWSSDKSQLGGQQFSLLVDDNVEAIVLPETLSKEPLGPSVRDYDSEWEDVVRWVVNGMIIAEEQGVTRANVASMAANPPNNTVARMLGVGFGGGAPDNPGHRAR